MILIHPSSAIVVILFVGLVALAGSKQASKEQEALFPASPVVGILTQPLHQPHHLFSGNQTNQQYYIAASYVKWLEAGGARSIPIPYDATDPDLLDDLFSQIQLLFLPGGAAKLPFAVTYLLNKAAASNQNGDFFPVWGTCLGFEFLLQHFGKKKLPSGFAAENMSLPLHQVQPVGLYRDPVIYSTVTTENVTLNNHHSGIEPRRFLQNPALTALWQVTSTNHDAHHRPFVSTIEPWHPDTFPFFGVQYHPEKNAFEYATYPHTNIPYEDINHSGTAVEFSVRLARFVVGLTGRVLLLSLSSTNGVTHYYTQPDRFPLVGTYPQQVGISFEQVFLVPNATHFMVNNTTTSDAAHHQQQHYHKRLDSIF